MWDTLKQYHEKSTLSNKVILIWRICGAKMGEGGDMEEHFDHWSVNGIVSKIGGSERNSIIRPRCNDSHSCCWFLARVALSCLSFFNIKSFKREFVYMPQSCLFRNIKFGFDPQIELVFLNLIFLIANCLLQFQLLSCFSSTESLSTRECYGNGVINTGQTLWRYTEYSKKFFKQKYECFWAVHFYKHQKMNKLIFISFWCTHATQLSHIAW